LTGLCARAVLNNGQGGGLDLLEKQGIAVAAAAAWAAIVTFVLLKGIDVVVGLRVDPETEHDGLDGALHGESAYGSPGGIAHGS
jgi:Amt family ammonium transporter